VDFFRDFSDLMGEKDPSKKWMDSFDGRKNMEVWSNMGYPPVIKRGNWKSPNGNIILESINGEFSIATFDYRRVA